MSRIARRASWAAAATDATRLTLMDGDMPSRDRSVGADARLNVKEGVAVWRMILGSG